MLRICAKINKKRRTSKFLKQSVVVNFKLNKMIYPTNGRELSLVEQKKLQWAREKEEISRLSEMFSATTTTHQTERTSIRTYYSNMDLTTNTQADNSLRQNDYYTQANGNHRDNVSANGDPGYYYHQYDESQNERIRSPSLPPIGRNKLRAKQPPPPPSSSNTQITDEDTSGYLSDSRNSPDIWTSSTGRSRSRFRLPEARGQPSSSSSYPVHNINAGSGLQQNPIAHPYGRNQPKQMQQEYNHFANNKNRHFELNNPQDSNNNHHKMNNMRMKENLPQKMMSCVVGSSSGAGNAQSITGQGRKFPTDEVDDNEHETDFCIPKTPSSTSSDGSREYSVLSSYPDVGYRKDKEERAKWGDRGVTVGHLYEPLVKDENTKPRPGWLEKSFHESEDESVRSYSFIRGQNAPIDSNTLAERASRRLKAIEFQNAIKKQLEERERIKRIEEEKRLLEEREQDERIRKQMQQEQERVALEQRKQLEKLEIERKKSEIMRNAIERAKQAAEDEKTRRKREVAVHSMAGDDIPQRDTSPIRSLGYASNIEEEREGQPNRDFSVNNKQLGGDGVEENKTQTSIIEKNQSSPSIISGNAIEDGGKILIGSPIRMRKKTVNNPNKLTKNEVTHSEPESTKNFAKESDVEGIALVLQSLPPIIPMISSDLLTLNQNLSTINNIQLAVMLAHQIQYLNPLGINMSSPGQQQQQSQTTERVHRSPPSTANSCSTMCPNSVNSGSTAQPNSYLHLIRSPETTYNHDFVEEPFQNYSESTNSDKEVCKICDKKRRPQRTDDFNFPISKNASNDRTFTRNMTKMKDSATLTANTPPSTPTPPFTAISNTDQYVLIQSCPQSPLSVATLDASTQTDDDNNKIDPNCCCQRNQYHHHHHVYVKEIPSSRSPFHARGGREGIQTIAIDILNNQMKELGGENTITAALIRSKAITTTDCKIELKEIKEPLSIQDRPKWGVNRPTNQYVKASERDPMYMRNKRKKFRKLFSLDNNNSDAIDSGNEICMSRSTSPSLITSDGNESAAKLRNKKISRNICTEILPIKTDISGRVYLNFHEASMIMSEAEVQQNMRKQHGNMDRVMNRRRTSDDILRDLGNRNPYFGSSERNKLVQTRRSNTDVDIE